MIDGVEELLHIKIEYPILLLTPLATSCHCIQRATPGPVPIGILMEEEQILLHRRQNVARTRVAS